MPEVAGPTQLHFLTTSKSIVELWPFAAAEIDERPVFRPCRQFLPDWVFQNIICFLPATFVMPQAMLKEIVLPPDANGLGRPLLPFADHEPDGFVRGRK